MLTAFRSVALALILTLGFLGLSLFLEQFYYPANDMWVSGEQPAQGVAPTRGISALLAKAKAMRSISDSAVEASAAAGLRRSGTLPLVGTGEVGLSGPDQSRLYDDPQARALATQGVISPGMAPEIAEARTLVALGGEDPRSSSYVIRPLYSLAAGASRLAGMPEQARRIEDAIAAEYSSPNLTSSVIGLLVFLVCLGLTIRLIHAKGDKAACRTKSVLIQSAKPLESTTLQTTGDETTKIAHENKSSPVSSPKAPSFAVMHAPKIPKPWWQSRIVIIGIILIIVVLAFPPWKFWVNTASMRRETLAGISFIFNPPELKIFSAEWNVSIAYGQLVIECAVIMALTACALVIRSRSK